MDIIFYKLQDKVNDVNKTKTLTATTTYTPITIQGTLRGATSKVSPAIDFAKDVTYFNGWNYCYIADFNRYYFVEDVVSVRVGITTVSLRVDVLTSFLTQSNMDNLEGFVGRCANDLVYDTYIPDKMVQFKDKINVWCSTPTSTPANQGNSENITFDISTSLSGNIVLSAFNYSTTDSDFPIQSITIPSVLSDLTITTTLKENLFQPKRNCNCYVLNSRSNDVESVLYAIANASQYAGFVYNLVAFPFAIPNTTGTTKYKVKLSNDIIPLFPPESSITDIEVPMVTRYNSGFLILKDFTLNYPVSDFHSGDFITREPYSMCEIFIPFASWVKVNIKENVGCRLIVMYNVNYLTGDCTVYLYNKTKNVIIFQTNAQIGIQYSISVTNARENLVKDQSYTRNFVMGMLGGVASSLLGGIAGNPVMLAGGVVGTGKTVMNYINNESMLVPQGNANVSNTSASSGIFGGLKVLVKWSQMIPANYGITVQEQSSYIEHLGLPTNKVLKLSSIKRTGVVTYAEIIDLHNTSEDGSYSIGDITYKEYEELKILCSEGIYI